ncbi:hypothetical protein GCM10027061_02170 [Nesterenkonia suensis]
MESGTAASTSSARDRCPKASSMVSAASVVGPMCREAKPSGTEKAGLTPPSGLRVLVIGEDSFRNVQGWTGSRPSPSSVGNLRV